jgi:hypothetical protein
MCTGLPGNSLSINRKQDCVVRTKVVKLTHLACLRVSVRARGRFVPQSRVSATPQLEDVLNSVIVQAPVDDDPVSEDAEYWDAELAVTTAAEGKYAEPPASAVQAGATV